MSSQLENARATFGPQQFKTFEGALQSLLASECPQLGGVRSRQVIVQAISELVAAHYPAATHMTQGQVRWTCVDKAEKSSYGKKMSQSQLTAVVLDLLPASEIAARAEGGKLRAIKVEATSRLFLQAYEQGGVLTNCEVALLLKLSPNTVGTYRREWEKEHGKLLPTRGSIHDMGPTLTHKKIILEKLLFDGKSVETVCRETDHSPEAVLRYTQNFKQVLMCQSKGMDVVQISYATQLSVRLIKEHLALITDFKSRHTLPDGQCVPLQSIIDTLDKHPAVLSMMPSVTDATTSGSSSQPSQTST
jgi:hypothetical protein